MRSRIAVWSTVFLVLAAIFIDSPKFSDNVFLHIPQVKIWSRILVPKADIDLTDYLDKFPLKLGLDLQGGTQLVLRTKMDKIDPQQKDTALASAREVIERRVNLFGVSEALVQTSKLGEERRILVDLPGIKDASTAASLVGKTAQLEFRELPATPSADSTSSLQAEATQSALFAIFSATPTGLTGADLKKASVAFGSNKGGKSGPQVSLEFTNEGSKKFAEITKRNVGRALPIFLDDEPVSSPVVEQEIVGGPAVISGNFTTEQAKALSIQLNAGALPVPIEILEQRSIGANLGKESINKSLVAGFIGLFIVMGYMGLYYGVMGIIADIALVVYTIFVLAIFKTGLFVLPPVTLTLAGIAGFILSIGMAVDANILIFERIKEEKRWGKSTKVALDLGFKRAWSSIRDSNISSLITSLILYFFGTGLVRGFALTLGVGVLVSMFSAITVTRAILRLLKS